MSNIIPLPTVLPVIGGGSTAAPYTPTPIIPFVPGVSKVIPDAVWTAPVDRQTLSEQPRVQNQQLTIAAAGEVIPFGYGRVMMGAKVLQPIIYGSGISLLIPAVIGVGPIGGVDAIYFDDTLAPSGVTYSVYDGKAASNASPDPLLVSAWLFRYNGPSVVYADTMPGVGYIVIQIPRGANLSFQNIRLICRLSLVYNPLLDSTSGVTGASGSQRLNDKESWAYSNVAALALAHFLSCPGIGPEEALDWQSVANCIDSSRTVNLNFDSAQNVDAVEEQLRSYAGVMLDRGGPTVRFVKDAPSSSVYVFSNAYPSNYLSDSLELSRSSRRNSPTVVTVKYTDTSKVPWGELEVTRKASGVDSGVVPWAEQVVQWPGCQDGTMAVREAVRRVNEYTLSDSSMRLVGTDETLRLRRGDVVTVVDGEGFTVALNKRFRITECYPIEPGRWNVAGTQYEDSLYSTDVYSGPTSPGTGLANPFAPPTPGTVTVNEVVTQVQAGGSYQSRLSFTWPASTWGFVLSYYVELWRDNGGVMTLVASADTSNSSSEWMSGIVVEGYTYQVRVFIKSTMLALSATPSTTSYLVVGKTTPPSNVASVTAVQVGNNVEVEWTAISDLDCSGYEIRVGTTSDTWDSLATSAVYRDMTTGLTATIAGLVSGTWRIMVCARDFVRTTSKPNGNYSATPAQVDVVVTGLDQVNIGPSYATANLTNMVEYTLEGQSRRWVGSNVAHTISNVTPTMATQTSVLSLDFAAGGNTGPCKLVTEWYDLGSSLRSTVQITANVVDLGCSGSKLWAEFSDDGSSVLSSLDATSGAVTASGRYVRVMIQNSSAVSPGPCPLITGFPVVSITASGLVAAASMKMNSQNSVAPAVDSTAAQVRTFLDVPTTARTLMLAG